MELKTFVPKKEKITIDIVSDVACPWCYIGKKKLETALEQFTETHDVEISWHPFQLDATIPTEGLEKDTYFQNKFGSPERIEQMFDRVSSVGKSVEIDFHFEKMEKVINTFSLHKLISAAKAENIQHEVADAIFESYFTYGIDLSDVNEIIGIFTKFGWPADKVKQILNDDNLSYEVSQEEKYYKSLGISGVPFYIFNKKLAVSGAQSPEVFQDAILSLQTESEGETCDVEAGNC